MTRTTYKTLIRKEEEGKVQIEQWDVKMGLALVTVYPKSINGRPTRHTVEVTGIPADVQN